MGLKLNNFQFRVSPRKKAWKPGNFAGSPVPSANAAQMTHIPGFKPGASAPDPVPAVSGKDFDAKAFTAAVDIEDDEMSWAPVDPIPSSKIEDVF